MKSNKVDPNPSNLHIGVKWCNGLGQERRNSNALAMKLRLEDEGDISITVKPLI